MAKAESSFNPFAVSPKGAVGIMQLMKDTARQYGVINRYNAQENIEAGVRHLKYLYEKFQGNIPLTLAAYNAGEEAVSKYNGVPPYRETKKYIRRVMSLMGMSYTFSSPAPRENEDLQIHHADRKDHHHRHDAQRDRRHVRDHQLGTEFARKHFPTHCPAWAKAFFSEAALPGSSPSFPA